MDFEWDEAKSEWNRVERDLAFDVVHDFDWEGSVTVGSPRRGELRFKTFGRHGDEYLAIVWTLRANKRRIISVRRMHAKEARKYGL